MKILFDLFLTFVRIGLFTFGGGYAMIPLIENACVSKKASYPSFFPKLIFPITKHAMCLYSKPSGSVSFAIHVAV